MATPRDASPPLWRRLVASASRGAGSEDAGDSLPLRAGMQLRERRMAEFSVDEVCEQLAVRRRGRLVRRRGGGAVVGRWSGREWGSDRESARAPRGVESILLWKGG